MPEPQKNLSQFTNSMLESTQVLWAPGKSDVSRYVQFKAGFMTITDNLALFLFGGGVYSHRFLIIPHIEYLYARYLPEQSFLIPGSRDDTGSGLTIFRTTGFTALLIDSGMIGMILFTANFMLVAWKLLKGKSPNRNTLLVVLLMAYAWLISNNIVDMMMLYLLIMPRGLIEQLIQNNVTRKSIMDNP